MIYFLLLWAGGSFATACSITVVGKLGGRFKLWEMVVGALVWPLALLFAWRDHKKMVEVLDERVKVNWEAPQPVFVCPETLCPACRASFDAVMTRISECRTCTPLPSRDDEVQH